MKKTKIKYFLFIIAGFLAISSVLMTVETATSGVEVSKLQEKERELSMEKRNLEASLVQHLSINDLETKSTELGFSKATAMVYITSGEEVVAKLP